MSGAADRTKPPAPGPIAAWEFPEVHRHVLANGVRVLAAPSGSVPVAAVRALVRSGASDEDSESAGLTTLAADLLESGAAGKSAGEIADALEGLGVDVEVGAGWDGSHAAFSAVADRVPAAWSVLADLIQRPDFPQDEVDRLRDERLAEIVQRRAQAGALADELVARAIFGADARFGLPLGGLPRTVQGLSREQVVARHTTRYTPAATSLIVAGAMDRDTAFRLAEERFGGWTATPGVFGAARAVQRNARRVAVVHRPDAVQSEIRLGHVGVARVTEDYFALAAMNSILGGSFSSRLNLNLREVHGYTYGVSSAFGMRRSPGPFLIATATETGVTVAAIGEILKEVRRLREEGCNEAELQDARSYLAGVFPLRLQTSAGLAAHLAEMEIYDLPEDHFRHYRERVLAVSQEQVNAAAQRHLHPDDLHVVVAGDAVRLRDELANLELGDVEIVSSPEELH